MNPFANNIGSYIDNDICNGLHAIVAGGGLDGVEVQGVTIDRKKFLSCVLNNQYVATLGAAETLKMTINIQESDDGTSWDTAVALQAIATVLTGASGGSTSKGLTEYSINLEGYKRYIRFNVTPTLSRAGTDTAAFLTSIVKGGAVEKPA